VSPASTWQRWTIDELDARITRVAVAETAYGLESSVAEAYDTRADVETFRQAVVDTEDVPPEHLWGDERAVYLRVADLQRFLNRRGQVRGLPDPRELREGDVFWILLPATMDETALRRLTPKRILAKGEALGVQVWDVTAAARQAAKRTYDSAVRAAGDDGSPASPAAGRSRA
jgi:hypothetical protein